MLLVTRVDQQLRAEGVPVVSVSESLTGTLTAALAPEATAAQRARAAALCATPPPAAVARSLEQRLAELEARVSALEGGRA